MRFTIFVVALFAALVVISANPLDVEEVENGVEIFEDETHYIETAKSKCIQSSCISKCVSLKYDSGICVNTFCICTYKKPLDSKVNEIASGDETMEDVDENKPKCERAKCDESCKSRGFESGYCSRKRKGCKCRKQKLFDGVDADEEDNEIVEEFELIDDDYNNGEDDKPKCEKEKCDKRCKSFGFDIGYCRSLNNRCKCLRRKPSDVDEMAIVDLNEENIEVFEMKPQCKTDTCILHCKNSGFGTGYCSSKTKCQCRRR